MIRRTVILAVCATPLFIGAAQQSPPTAEQVFKNVKVFQGVPASDMIPAMEFMSASLGYKCADCHDPKDYAAETKLKDTTRQMVLLQRDINQKYFNGRLEVTCMSCHNGKEHPASMPIPQGLSFQHERPVDPPAPEALFAKHVATVGKAPVMLTRTGTLTAPNDVSHKMETTPLEFVQTSDGRYRLVSGDRKVTFDGSATIYGGFPLTDEPVAIFGRIGRSYRGEKAFDGVSRTTVSGQNKIGKASVIVVRGSRAGTASTEEMYFDSKSGLLTRLVNIKRSTIGSVVMAMDYADYKNISGTRVPMKVTATFADGTTWTMSFKSAKVADLVDESLFKQSQ
ncbi:MAG TPA: photosynthetic reaction center cytochrome c subunit family protein [Fimbriimonadaceae bacterium]|nr:photosynthetic reaction center cytochrome c subunit family protein [Fimbriimonadaceae bacterium]